MTVIKNTERAQVSLDDSLAMLVKKKLQHYIQLLDGHKPTTNFYTHIIQEVERPLIELTLEMTEGNRIQAAKILGINRNTLRKKMNELGL